MSAWDLPADARGKVVLTNSNGGALTSVKQFPFLPVTPADFAREGRAAYNEGATIVHAHFRNNTPGKLYGTPSWDPATAKSCCDAIRDECPGMVINMSTGTAGQNVSQQIACLNAVRPDMAALNSGSLNYLKMTAKDKWAWPPMVFDNDVRKIAKMAKAMDAIDCVPECECFDVGIVRSIELYQRAGILKPPAHVSMIMGVQSGMPCRADLLPILRECVPKGAHWQGILIGREEIWPVHRAFARLGGNMRTGLEDTMYLPNGDRAESNGTLIKALAMVAREEGRTVATPEEARILLKQPFGSQANL